MSGEFHFFGFFFTADFLALLPRSRRSRGSRQVLIDRPAHGAERGDPRGVRRGIGPRWKLYAGDDTAEPCAGTAMHRPDS